MKAWAVVSKRGKFVEGLMSDFSIRVFPIFPTKELAEKESLDAEKVVRVEITILKGGK